MQSVITNERLSLKKKKKKKNGERKTPQGHKGAVSLVLNGLDTAFQEEGIRNSSIWSRI